MLSQRDALQSCHLLINLVLHCSHPLSGAPSSFEIKCVMRSGHRKWILWSEVLLAWLILFLLGFYTYAEFVKTPYVGFGFEPANGEIDAIYYNLSTYPLQIGDYLVSVNGVPFSHYRSDLRASLLPYVDDLEPLILEFRGQEGLQAVHWPVLGFNELEFFARLKNSFWVGILFWVTGVATLLLVRPLDTKRRLFVAFFLLTALWLVVGNTSRWGYYDSRVLYRVALWFSVPVLLHLHWLFPRPLGTLPRWLVLGFYGAIVIIGALQWTPWIDQGASAIAYALALLGSLCLLVIHYLRQPAARSQIRLLVLAMLFAILPIAALSLSFAFRAMPPGASFALISLPLIPGAYFYSIYRYQLGGSEFRANRLIAVYLFLILLGTLLPIGIAFFNVQSILGGGGVLLSTLIALLVALVTIYGFPLFQRLVERRLLAMPLPSVQLIDTYLARITTTLNDGSLVTLLKDEVLPSMLIRQSALLRISNNEAITIYNTGYNTSDNTGDMSGGLTPTLLTKLVTRLKQDTIYRLPASQGGSLSTWVRLALALKVEGRLIGLWLLGRHDPDDIYSPVEIATLQTLARQTALALANIEQAAQLQALYQANIERQEQERMKMAHFLHDAILNQAAILYMSLNAATLTPQVQDAYETLKEQIHQMISNLRPPSLDLGLGAALEELAGELDQRAHTKFALRLNLPTTAVHYPPHIENHIFRIVQQACENAFRHASAQFIQVSGTLAPDHVDLTIEDDGVGFVLGKPLNLTYLLANKHFGLVHMMERAEHISAELALESAPGQGTRVHLTWTGNEHTGD